MRSYKVDWWLASGNLTLRVSQTTVNWARVAHWVEIMQRKWLMLNVCFPLGVWGFPYAGRGCLRDQPPIKMCGSGWLMSFFVDSTLPVLPCLLREELNLSYVFPLLEICALFPPSSLLCVFSFCWICFVYPFAITKPSHEYNYVLYPVGSSHGSLKLGWFGGPLPQPS